MAKTIVLVRHAKAAPRSLGVDDERRPLTAAGRRSCAAWLARSRELFGAPAEDVVLWTSAAERARETARLVARAWRLPEPQDRACLTACDVDAFVEEALVDDAGCIVAVGHNPFVEEALDRLCGAQVACSTAAVAAVSVPDAEGDEREPRLLWFVQGPRSIRWKALCDLDAMLCRQANRTEKRLAGFLGDPSDVEALHDFRVAVRTMRSLLSFCRPFAKRGAWRDIDRRLSRAVRRTSRLRDLDVLIAEAERMDPPATELVAACRRERSRACDRTVRAFRSKKTGREITRALDAARRLPWRDSVEAAGLDRDAVTRRFAEMVDAFGARMDVADYEDVEETHAVRKLAKGLRYAAENVPGLPESHADEIAALMRDVQDDLGALCDARVHIDIISSFPTDGLPEEALRDLAILKARSMDFVRSFPYPGHAAEDGAGEASADEDAAEPVGAPGDAEAGEPAPAAQREAEADAIAEAGDAEANDAEGRAPRA